MRDDQVANGTEEAGNGDYPLRGTRAQVMLEESMKAAQGAGRSQRDVAGQLGYKSSVVLSHMTAGRVPIPIDRAKDIAKALGLEPNNFLLGVLEQRFPDVDFKSLFHISYSSDKMVRRLESIAGCSLDDLPADTRAVLEEVVAARNPRRRWLELSEIAALELIRDLRPEGLTGDDRQAVEKALRRS